MMRRTRSRWIPFIRSSPRSARSTPPVVARNFSSRLAQVRSENVGFIGLGNMGFHMAMNLIHAGYKLTVHDINQDAMKKFKEIGIPTKETPFDIGESSDIVVTMLPSSSSVLEVYTGRNGLLHAKHPSRPWLFIDSSTVDPQTSRTVSNKVSKQTLKECIDDLSCPLMLDAPVSGGVPGAESGTLTFMVGGFEDAFIAAKPVLQSMGRRTIYCGPSGNGAVAKICNNLAMAVSMVGVSEAFALGQRLGISATTLADIFNSSSARCWSRYEELCEGGHEAEDFSCVFRHRYFGKDEKGL